METLHTMIALLPLVVLVMVAVCAMLRAFVTLDLAACSEDLDAREEQIERTRRHLRTLRIRSAEVSTHTYAWPIKHVATDYNSAA